MIAAVVVNFGTADLIAENMRDYLGLWIVDNFKSDGERSSIRQVADAQKANLIEIQGNLGFGVAANVAIEQAIASGASTILLINPDVKLSFDRALRLAEEVERNPGVMCSPRLLDSAGDVWFEGSVILPVRGIARHGPVVSNERLKWVTAACLAFSAEAWQTLGGFSSEYFLYWEDVDFTYRWKRSGGDLRVLREIEGVHAVGGSQGGEGKSLLYTRFVTRNRLVFANANLRPRQRFVWFATSPLFAVSVVKNANHASRWSAIRHFGVACWATIATTFALLLKGDAGGSRTVA